MYKPGSVRARERRGNRDVLGLVKKENNQKKGRERWKMEDLGISWDFPPQVTYWDGKHLLQSLSIFLHDSKEKIVFFLTVFFFPS